MGTRSGQDKESSLRLRRRIAFALLGVGGVVFCVGGWQAQVTVDDDLAIWITHLALALGGAGLCLAGMGFVGGVERFIPVGLSVSALVGAVATGAQLVSGHPFSAVSLALITVAVAMAAVWAWSARGRAWCRALWASGTG